VPGEPSPVLLALHGHDDDPARFAAQIRPLTAARGWTLLAPAGPLPTTSGRAWFASPDDPDGPPLGSTLDQLERTVAAPQAEGRPVVLGWSQGAATALALTLRAGASIRASALVALAPWLPNEPGVDWDLSRESLGDLSVLVVHGLHDDVVDVQQGRSVRRVLERAGIDVTLAEVEARHELHALLAEVPAWLDR
jgi:predicted esterase